jgi:hypothetical protein
LSGERAEVVGKVKEAGNQGKRVFRLSRSSGRCRRDRDFLVHILDEQRIVEIRALILSNSNLLCMVRPFF